MATIVAKLPAEPAVAFVAKEEAEAGLHEPSLAPIVFKVKAPAGIKSGDVFLVHVTLEVFTPKTVKLKTPGGWEVFAETIVGEFRKQLVYWLRYTGGVTEWEFTIESYGFEEVEWRYCLLNYRNCVGTGSPIDDAVVEEKKGIASEKIKHPGITTTKANDVVVTLACNDFGWTFAVPTGFTSRFAGRNDEATADKLFAAAGATGTIEWTVKGTNASASYAIIAFGLIAGLTAIKQTQAIGVTRKVIRGLSTSQSQARVLSKSTSRALAISQSQARVLVKAISRSTSCTQGQSTSIVKAPARVLAVSQGQSLTSPAPENKTLTATLEVVQPQSSSTQRAVSRTLAASAPCSSTLEREAARALSVAQAQSTSRSAIVTRALSAEAGQTIVRVSVVSRALTVAQAQASSITRALARVLLVAQGTAAFVERVLSEALAVEQPQTASSTSTVSRSLSAAQTSTASSSLLLSRILGAAQEQSTSLDTPSLAVSFTISQESAASVSRLLSRSLTIVQSQAPAQIATIARGLAASSNQDTTVVLSSQITLAVLDSTSSVVMARAISRTLAVAQEQTALEETVGSKERVFPIAQGQTITRSVVVSRGFPITAHQSIARLRRIAKAFVVGQAQSASLAVGQLFEKFFSVAQPQQARTQVLSRRTIVIGQISTPTIGRAIERTLVRSQPQTMILHRSSARLLSAEQQSNATLTVVTGDVRLLIMAQSTSSELARGALRVLRSSVSSTTTLAVERNIVHLPPITITGEVGGDSIAGALSPRSSIVTTESSDAIDGAISGGASISTEVNV